MVRGCWYQRYQVTGAQKKLKSSRKVLCVAVVFLRGNTTFRVPKRMQCIDFAVVFVIQFFTTCQKREPCTV